MGEPRATYAVPTAAAEAVDVRLLDGELPLAEGYARLTRPDCGGLATFVGAVRDRTDGRAVTALEFEAYAPMAVAELRAIGAEAVARFGLSAAVLWHGLGPRAVGAPVVLTGAAAPHREAAFRACRYLIDELKARAPIWKRERFADGSHWVNAHP